jgi:hypothetical protein
MTRQQRFFVTTQGFKTFAPSTIPAPCQVQITNRFFFKKTDEEKAKLKDLKKGVINKTFTSRGVAQF